MPSGFNLTVARLIVAAAVAVVIIAIVALVIVLVLRGGPEGGSAGIAGLVSFIGILVGLLGNLLATQRIASSTQDIQAKVNGHLAAHIAHTDDQVRAIVQDEIGPAGLPGPPGR